MSEQKILKSEDDARSYVRGLADDQSWGRLENFARLLVNENQKQNLISRPSEAHLWIRHIADSAQLIEHVSATRGTGPWLDLGSGPGLPGLVVAVLKPDISVVLVEARRRRVDFLRACTAELGLLNCTIQGCKLEAVTPFQCSVISARAFAPLEKLLRLSAPFSTNETRYILPKGRSAEQELSLVKPSIRSMFHVKHSLTDADAGIIVSE